MPVNFLLYEKRGENMTNLECNVCNCAYNSNNYCHLTDIEVKGAAAHHCEGTCCASFEEEINSNSAVNASLNMNDTPITQVHCNAHHCLFNEAGECCADCICVDGNGACEKSETECASFCDKHSE